MQYFYNRLYILQIYTSEFIFLPGRGPTPNNHNKNSINHLSTKKKKPPESIKKNLIKKNLNKTQYIFSSMFIGKGHHHRTFLIE
jgi:hypothetical protein